MFDNSTPKTKGKKIAEHAKTMRDILKKTVQGRKGDDYGTFYRDHNGMPHKRSSSKRAFILLISIQAPF